MGPSAVPAPPVGSRFAVAGDRVFDARAGAWADGTVVLVEDQVIAGIARSAPEGWPVIEMPGTSLLPGLIDAHTHVLLRSSWNELELARQMVEENLGHRAASAVQAMSIAVRHGFTTIRDLGTEGAGHVDVGLRDAAREGMVPGPRMLVAGPAIRSTGRYPLPGGQHSMTFPAGIDSCTGADACRETVRTQVAHGIDCLKIYVSESFEAPSGEEGYPDGPLVWTEEEVRALVDEAHRQRIRVAAHSLTLSGARLAVTAGVDSIEHGFAISPELAADMAARGTALVPTLLVTREHAEHGAHMSEPVRAAHNRSFVNCLEAGVPIVLGTDVGGFEWTRVSQAEEFALMTRLGMSPANALRAGTLWAAELLGLAGTAGVIEPGAAADIVAVAGDPLRDIECLQQVELVIQGGQIAWDGHHLAWDGVPVRDRNPRPQDDALTSGIS
jgi:imidazolonepropionase-like amidohydrolase